MKALYSVVFLLMEQMQKHLTRTGTKGISISFRVLQFQVIACDIHSHLAREVKINLKQRFGMFVKKENSTPCGTRTNNVSIRRKIRYFFFICIKRLKKLFFFLDITLF